MAEVQASSAIPYLRSCKKDCEKPVGGELTGEIPKWLKGSLIRVGCGLREVGPDSYNHLFDGLALMHRFGFQEGNVVYQSRFLKSDAYRKNMKENRIIVSEFATKGMPDPCKTIFQRFSSLFSPNDTTDNDLVNIIMFSDEAYASTESSKIWQIDPETLESIQKVNLSNFLPINAAVAHAHEDKDGTVYNVGSIYGFNSSYAILKFPPKGDKTENPFQSASVVCKIPSSKFLTVSYHHSFGMSENYFVFVEQPLYLSVRKLMTGTFAGALHWDDNAQCRFHVVRRSDGKLLNTTYVSKGFFAFHHINTYEEDNQLVVDMCCYDNGDIIKILYFKALEDNFVKNKSTDIFFTRGKRYVLPLEIPQDSQENKNLVTLSKSEATAYRQPNGNILCEPETLTGTEPWAPELPRINYGKYNGKKYKYYYAMARNDELKGTHVIKVDTENKTTVSWGEAGVVPSEPVFLSYPDANDKDEDAGVLLASLLYQDDECKVSMLVLDAKTMKEVGRVTFKTEASVPGDFHGTFVTKK